MGIFYNGLFLKIATSLNHGLNPLAELSAGLGHGVLWEAAHDLRIFALREAAVLWGFLFASQFTANLRRERFTPLAA
jgi:hypothetical protein